MFLIIKGLVDQEHITYFLYHLYPLFELPKGMKIGLPYIFSKNSNKIILLL